jgi:cytochrome c oxidase subunit 3
MTTDEKALLPVEHNPLASMPHDTHGGTSNPVLGMILFITSEVMFFGGLFAAYFNLRANAPQWPPEEFAHTLKILPFVGPATILLIISSFTCQWAVWAIRRDDRTVFIRGMAVTVVLGIVFLLMQITDYAFLGQEGLTLASGQFGTT